MKDNDLDTLMKNVVDNCQKTILVKEKSIAKPNNSKKISQWMTKHESKGKKMEENQERI